jgi:hypothetical protein
MLVYHGTYMEIQEPDPLYGRYNLDFGKGFYVTTLQKQADKWASRRAKAENGNPFVNIYEFDNSDLNILRFEGYTEEWLDFIVECRAGTVKPHQYDAVFGNIANDDVAATVDEYIRLLRKNRVNADVKRATLYQLTFSKPNDQYCITTQKGIKALIFIESYRLEV